MPAERGRYEPLESISIQKHESESVCDDDLDVDGNIPASTQPMWTRKQANMAFAANIVMLLVSLCALLISLGKKPALSDLECAKKVSTYSPAWDAVQYWEGSFNNAFNVSSIYRGPPTLEREQAWHALWYQDVLPIDKANLEALNQTHRGKHVEVLGSDPANPQYGAYLEVFHQLHCLNVLRQHSWGLSKFDPSWPKLLYPSLFKDRVMTRMHVDHCIETLRISLMCTADVTPLLYLYDKERTIGFSADFNTFHKCRDFDKIVSYVKKNGFQLELKDENH